MIIKRTICLLLCSIFMLSPFTCCLAEQAMSMESIINEINGMDLPDFQRQELLFGLELELPMEEFIRKHFQGLK